jgi:hypothetical protein
MLYADTLTPANKLAVSSQLSAVGADWQVLLKADG